MRQVEKEELEGHDEEPDIEELCERFVILQIKSLVSLPLNKKSMSNTPNTLTCLL